MKFKEYKKEAKKTAIYPRYGEKVVYPALGLCGESGEVADKLKKVIRDNNGILTKDLREGIALELGDVMWYLANFSMDVECHVCDSEELNQIEFAYSITDIYSQAIKLCSRASYIAENCSSLMNENGFGGSYYIKKCISIVATIADKIGFSLEDICEMNIKKLEDREARKKINGSGDYR